MFPLYRALIASMVCSNEMKNEIDSLQDFVDDQVELIDDSLDESEAKYKEAVDEYQLEIRHRSDFEAEMRLWKTIEENYERIMKHRKLVLQAEDDLERLELCIKSTYRVKFSLFWFCFEAILGTIFMLIGPPILGYLHNLMAVLKIPFAFLELSGLQNWQRNKVLANLVIHLMEHLVWLIYAIYLLLTMANYGSICFALTLILNFLKCLYNPFDPESVHMQIWNQYSDMKKSRPIIPNFGAFPA